MLATISSYWFMTLPAVLTGLLLMRMVKKTHEARQARQPAPAKGRRQPRS